MAYPFFLQRCDGLEKFHFPLLVLRQRVIDDKQAVVVDASHIFHNLVNWTRTELTTTKIRHSTGIATETASARSVEQVNHLHTLVVVQFALVKVATARTY
ncbi:MAG: hypothetical protein J5542_09090 [Bacteroidales bacterium]|nr:hypothetical protein [Bacteroidales bacterium]